jgi:hypothetical protein
VGAIDIGGAQLGQRQVAATEDIERKKTTVFIVSVENEFSWWPWTSMSVASVADASGHTAEQIDLPSTFAEQQNACIRSDFTAVESRENQPTAEIDKPHTENTLFFRSPLESTLWL